MAGDADTLRDYWSGHGHAGPSHGAERDAIGWGTPGDFMRCVAQVTEHGHMTPEQAKGYCNLRHHDALGYYPAQHARMSGKAQSSGQQQDGGGEARVAAGSGVTSGQWTTGSDGPTQNPPKPNPYAKKPAKGKPGSKKPAAKKPGAKKPPPKAGAKPGAKPGGKSQSKAQIKQQIAGLEQKLSGLRQEENSLKAKLPKSTASTGASSSSTSGGSSTSSGSSASSSSPSSSSSSGSSGSSGSSSSGSSGTSQVQQQLQQVQAQIQQVHQQIAQLRQQLAKAKAWEAEVTKAGRNVRDSPSGRFRTFEGESKEASHAFREGRIGDAVDYLGSARALATEPGHRTTLDTLQRSLARVQHMDLTKSFIRGDSIAHGDKTGFHEGSAGNGHVYLRTREGVRYRVPKKEIRPASDTESEDLYRQETDPGLPVPPDEKETAKKGSLGLTESQSAWFDRNMGENSVNKVGPHGYIHGWIKVGAGAGKISTGETVAASDGSRTVVGAHSGTKNGKIAIKDATGNVTKVPAEAVRPATMEEHVAHVNQNWANATTPELKQQHQLAYGSSLPSMDTYNENVARQQPSLGYDSSGNRPAGSGMDVLRQQVGSPTTPTKPDVEWLSDMPDPNA